MGFLSSILKVASPLLSMVPGGSLVGALAGAGSEFLGDREQTKQADTRYAQTYQQQMAMGEAANAQRVAAAQTQMDFQERMSNTSHQRQIEDLAAAGLNPILSSKYGGSSTPGGAMAAVADVHTPAASTALARSRQHSELRQMRANADNAQAAARRTKAETINVREQHNVIRQNEINARQTERVLRNTYEEKQASTALMTEKANTEIKMQMRHETETLRSLQETALRSHDFEGARASEAYERSMGEFFRYFDKIKGGLGSAAKALFSKGRKRR